MRGEIPYTWAKAPWHFHPGMLQKRSRRNAVGKCRFLRVFARLEAAYVQASGVQPPGQEKAQMTGAIAPNLKPYNLPHSLTIFAIPCFPRRETKYADIWRVLQNSKLLASWLCRFTHFEETRRAAPLSSSRIWPHEQKWLKPFQGASGHFAICRVDNFDDIVLAAVRWTAFRKRTRPQAVGTNG